MAHRDPTPLRWQDYLLIKTITFIEGFAMKSIPRGALRKRLLTRLDRVLQRIHANRCGKPRL